MPTSRPHVLLFICDQMQAPRPAIAQTAPTPALDALAADGVRFTNAYCANAQCVPSRVSLQTGLYPHEAEVMIIYGFHGHSAHLDGTQLTSGQVFRDAGYTTAYFGKT
ncbi:MAG: sulfatase-like hydrolase/transferase, partial [Chloroflexi bacterium]|nr:sulfatase-like hydrolase/transferase [Chloroflexota bacterium]